MSLKSNAVTKPVRIYSVNSKKKKMINLILDNLHDQNKINFITQLIKFN